ncbi:hypothetical protein JHK87_047655 [Glycine soja]|nr:hypothetical protein JHK87_047655 [Glycine soja]
MARFIVQVLAAQAVSLFSPRSTALTVWLEAVLHPSASTAMLESLVAHISVQVLPTISSSSFLVLLARTKAYNIFIFRTLRIEKGIQCGIPPYETLRQDPATEVPVDTAAGEAFISKFEDLVARRKEYLYLYLYLYLGASPPVTFLRQFTATNLSYAFFCFLSWLCFLPQQKVKNFSLVGQEKQETKPSGKKA